MKIRTAIFGVYVAASAIGFAILMSFVLRDVHRRYVESMRRTLGDTAAFLASFAAKHPERSAGSWVRPLESLPPGTELLRVFACDRDGRVVFDTGGRDVGRTYRWPMRGGGRAASENYTVSNVAEVDGELRVAAPVRRDGVHLGWVGVGRPLASVADGVRQARVELLWSAALVAGGMVLAGWWISSQLTRSLERLTAYAEAVREGRPARPPSSRATEISALGRAFEDMRVALEGKAYVERYTQALAHEFKAPLSSIRGAGELLAEGPPEADRARFVANLRAETERLQRIVDRLLELAALESRRAGAAFAEIDFALVVAEAADAAAGAARARKTTLDVAAHAPVRVRGDRFLLAQAIGNLLYNALEFAPAGGRVSVRLEVDARATVVVEDNGPGIPDYAVARIFERFYSLPRPDTGRKSSGLGLSIVREVARLHGGDAALQNRTEGGARATFSLPLA